MSYHISNDISEQSHQDITPKKKPKWILWGFVVLVIIAGAFVYYKFPKIHTIFVPKDDKELGIVQTNEHGMTGESRSIYDKAQGNTLNILLLGVDAEGYDKGRSDMIILLTLNKGSSYIKLTSFMRDLLAFSPSKEGFDKINHNYMYGGPIDMLKTLNMNYDLNLRDFVVFDFNALKALIDGVGGVSVDIDEDELNEFNSVAEVESHLNAEKIEEPGIHNLNGQQALIYSRIRYYSGGDEARNKRQREILTSIVQKAKGMGKKKLLALMNDILPQIRTSYTMTDLLEFLDYYEEIKGDARIIDNHFPFKRETVMYNEMSCEVPWTLEDNVVKLHKMVYGVIEYHVSDRIKRYQEELESIVQNN